MARGLGEESWLVRITGPITPLMCTSVEEGVRNHLWAATAGEVVSGRYYMLVGVVGREAAVERDKELGVRLWEWTEGELRG